MGMKPINVNVLLTEVLMSRNYFSLYYKPIKKLNDEVYGLEATIKINPKICQSLVGEDHIRNLSDFNGLCEKYGLVKDHMSNVLNKLRYDLPYLRVLKSIEIITFNAGLELLDDEICLELQSLIEYSSVCRLKLGCEVKKTSLLIMIHCLKEYTI